MRTKTLEVRDRATFIPILAVDMNPGVNAERYLLRRCGYSCDGRPNILLTKLTADGSPAWNDPYGWSNRTRTMTVAHNYIIEHWEELSDGDVVCVEYILGERSEPKKSERLES